MSSKNSASIRGKNSGPTELRIVLIGDRHVASPMKSLVGNIILGGDVFDTNKREAKSVMRQKLVLGRQVTVVYTPGWKTSYPLDLTPKLTRLEIQQSVYLCPPGPHAFVLVVPLDTTFVGTGMSTEEHVRFLLSDRIWKHAIVVFTVTGEDKMRHVSDLIRSDTNLKCLTQKCEDRYHVLNISDKGDRSQVTELLKKIDQMVTSNGCHYETEHPVSEELKEIEKRAEKRRAEAQKQTTRLPGHVGLTDLNILLMGQYWSGKSSTGNTILGGPSPFFKVGHGSEPCNVRHGKVAGRHVTVVDVPGWYYNSPRQNTSEMDKLEIQNSMCLCPPGPHAVLLLVPVDEAFTSTKRVAVEEHMTLLKQGVWSHTIVLFTRGDWLGDTSIEQHIEAEGEDLRWLLDRCENRYHVLNNNKKRDEVTQVTELLEKIEDVVARNQGGHYEYGGEDASEKLSERKSNIEEHAETFMTRTCRQRTALKALFEGEHQNLPDVRVMLVGGEHSGRSTAGNHILQEVVFTETIFKEYETQNKLTECVREQKQVAERNVSVVICPDWSTTPPSQKIKDVLQHGLALCSPGPHAVLLPVSVMSSFSEADRRSVEEHVELMGDRVWRHALVLFTWGWWLGARSVEEYIESEGEPLRWLLEKCGYRYHVLQFSDRDISEVDELMEKIEEMVTRNRGHFGPLDSREDRSVRDTAHFGVGHETRQKTLFERLKGKQAFTAEEWNRREEEWKKREEEWRAIDIEWKRKEEGGRRREEEWRRREEEMIERMLKLVVTEPEEPTLPAVRKRCHSKGGPPPSMSGGTPSEKSLYYWTPDKVSDWLLRHPGPIDSSSGYDTMSEAPSQTDTDIISKSL